MCSRGRRFSDDQIRASSQDLASGSRFTSRAAHWTYRLGHDSARTDAPSPPCDEDSPPTKLQSGSPEPSSWPADLSWQSPGRQDAGQTTSARVPQPLTLTKFLLVTFHSLTPSLCPHPLAINPRLPVLNSLSLL